MGGICGWIASGPGWDRRGGAGPAAAGSDAAAIRKAMTRAIAHRGRVEWLERPDRPGEARLVADGVFTDPGAPGAAWSSSGGDPAGFCSRLEGPFAVAVLDPGRRRLLLARDRLGERPLYYTVSDAGVAFATEIKALRAAGLPADRSLRPEALDAFLAFTYVPAPWTIYEHVHKVPAGHYIELPLDTTAPAPARAVRYWRLPARSNEGAGADDMLRMLDEALGRRMPVEGPVACLLSGGLDSSMVAALLSRRLKTRGGTLHTFCAAFSDARLDESSHARRVASMIGATHHDILLHELDCETAGRVIVQLDEPMADAACLPAYLLAREASGVAPVVMTGDGSDALLAGDHWFRRLAALDRLERLPRGVRHLLPVAGALTGPARFRKYRRLAGLVDLDPVDRYLALRLKWTREERRAVFSPDFARRVDFAAAEGTYRGAGVEWRRGASVDAAGRLDAAHGLPEDLLMKADKMSAAHGIESRSPFLDRAFAEWAAGLDIRLLLRGSTSKYLLKKAGEKVLPHDLVHRRKRGLQTPTGRWLMGPLAAMTGAAFDPGLIARQGIFAADALGRLRRAFEGGTSDAALAGKVWQIVVFQHWWLSQFE